MRCSPDPRGPSIKVVFATIDAVISIKCGAPHITMRVAAARIVAVRLVGRPRDVSCTTVRAQTRVTARTRVTSARRPTPPSVAFDPGVPVAKCVLQIRFRLTLSATMTTIISLVILKKRHIIYNKQIKILKISSIYKCITQ